MANLDFGAPIDQTNNFVYTGGELAMDSMGMIYAIQGNSRNGFAVYMPQDQGQGTWLKLPNLPMPANYGAQIEYDTKTNAIYFCPVMARHFFGNIVSLVEHGQNYRRPHYLFMPVPV